MNWSDKTLKILNLTDTEALILNTLTAPKSIQMVAEDSGVSRTGSNYVIKELLHKGLVHYSLVGKRRFYYSITLEQLSKKIKKALDEIEIANNEKKGAKIKLSKEDEFIIHVGVKEIIPAYTRIASENKNERIRAIQHHRSWKQLIEKITKEELIEFNETIKKNNIILDGMLNQSAYDQYWNEVKSDPEKHIDTIRSLEGRMADYTVFPDNFFDCETEIWIFKTTTLIINWYEEVAIEITNSHMTKFFKDMFEYVKAGGRKLDHNKATRELLSKSK